MKRQHRPRIKLSDDERKTLQHLENKQTAKQAIALRARIVLLADKGLQHQAIAQKLSIQNNTVTTWCNGPQYPRATSSLYPANI